MLDSKIPHDLLVEFMEACAIREQNDKPLSKTQKAHFLANCHHETRGWKNFVESLAYKPTRLLQVFPNRVGTIQRAKDICAGGEKSIGNFLYNGRMGNKLGSDDGYNFRGRGCIQLTGRDNYELFQETVEFDDIVSNPDLVATKYRIRSAMWFFDANKVWEVCNTNDATKCRKKVNGGTIGLKEVQRLFSEYLALV